MGGSSGKVEGQTRGQGKRPGCGAHGAVPGSESSRRVLRLGWQGWEDGFGRTQAVRGDAGGGQGRA